MTMNTPLRDWSGRRVWIVGASTGIGAALARQLLLLGARVALSARRPEPLEELARSHPGQALVCPLDVTVAPDVREAFGQIRSAWSGLDAMIYMAGVYQPCNAWDFDAGVGRRLFDVNFTGALHVLEPVVHEFVRARGGHIALVASVAGYRGLPKALFYGATKAALIHLAEGLYVDLAPKGIGVSVVNPGFVRTPLTADNDFRMPALIEPEEAAQQTLRGLARGEFEIHYPKRFTRFVKLASRLPYRWYFPLIHRVTGL